MTSLSSAKGSRLELAEKVQLRNQVSTLKKELDNLWDVVISLHDYVGTLAPITTSPGNPTTPNPAQVAVVNAAKVVAQTKKTALGGLLED